VRAMLDANVLLSYAIAKSSSSQTITRVVEAALNGDYTLVMPEELVTELFETGTRKNYFRENLDLGAFRDFIKSLLVIAELPEPLSIDLEPVVRDGNDDYLIAAGHLHEIDVLVSGDRDLLVLRDKVTAFQILSPREFLALIEG
jgi:predicted nucleic acid-binding protein